MTISATLPAPDEWERDLTELLGLGGDGRGAVSAGTRYKRASLLAIIAVASAVISLGVYFSWQRWSASRATHSTLVNRDVVQRSVPPVKLASTPVPPVARPGGTEVAVTAGGSSPPGLRANGGRTSLGSARSTIHPAPEALTASRATANRALGRTRERSLDAARVISTEDVVRSRPTRTPAILVTRNASNPSPDDRPRLVADAKVVLAGNDQPVPAPGNRSPVIRQMPAGATGPAPLPLRAQSRDDRVRGGRSMALDAIRLLRRQ